MDKLTILSGVLFGMSEVFAIASLAHEDWIHADDDGGSIVLGLTKQCQIIYGREKTCSMSSLPAEWIMSLILLIMAIITLAVTFCFIFSARWRVSLMEKAKWSGVFAVACLFGVGVFFPIGFNQLIVGGEAYKLPVVWQLGTSYKHLWVYTVVFSCSGLFLLTVPIRQWFIHR